MSRIYFLLIPLLLMTSCNRKKVSLEEMSREDLVRSAEKNSDLGNYLNCVMDYSRLIKLDSLKGINYFEMAYCLSGIDSFKLSAKNFKKSAELNHKVFESYLALAVIYTHEVPNDSLAMEYLTRALEINPESEFALDLGITIANTFSKREYE